MASVQQVQSVAKRLEKMLETALNQLKVEQQMRKESENKLMEFELDLVNKEHQIKSLEDQIVNIKSEKDEKISNLESTINFLQSVVIQKEKEVLNLQEVLNTKNNDGENYENLNLDRTVEKYEATLSQLIGGKGLEDVDIKDLNHENNASMKDIAHIKDDYNDTEEYILDESMEELNDAVSISEDIKPVVNDRKEVKKHKTRCSICKEVFVNKAALQEHQNETGHIVQFECELCDRKFKTKGVAQMHKARIHSTVFPFKCGKCEKRFKDQGSCRRHEANDSVHIRMENMKLNPNLICNICGKEFDRNRRWCLDQHLLTHLANKKFACDNCGQFYRQKSYLQTHMKVCLNTKGANCEECGGKFKTKTELVNHEKKHHSGDKPYLCSICSVSFGSYSSYIAHGKNVHNATSAKHFASIQEIISTSN